MTWGGMLDLIYSSRCRESLTFVAGICPAGKPAKEDFIWDVTEQVLRSWYGLRLPWIGGDLIEAAYGVSPGSKSVKDRTGVSRANITPQ